MSQWIAIGALGLIAVFIPLVMIVLSWLLRPSVDESGKRAAYESGEIPTGPARSRFHIQYYMVGLLFVIFDVETVMLLPWAMAFPTAVEEVGVVQALVPMLLFIGILLLGLIWAWRTGAVRWMRRQLNDNQSSLGIEQ